MVYTEFLKIHSNDENIFVNFVLLKKKKKNYLFLIVFKLVFKTAAFFGGITASVLRET